MPDGLSLRGNRQGKQKLFLAAAVLIASSRLADANQTWAPGGTVGGSGTWDTTSPNWLPGPTTWANTSSSNAYFGGTGGNITVVSTGVTTGNIGTFTTTGYNISGGTITENGGGFTIVESSGVNTTVTAPIAGSSGAIFDGNSYNTSTLTLGGNNSYAGTTLVETMACYFPVLATTGNNSSFGSSGNVDIGSTASTVDMYYTGSTAGTTDRDWVWVGSSYGYVINNGAGPLSFNNPGSAIGGITGAKIFQFGGNTTNTSTNTFAENISDSGTGANISSVIISYQGWEFTNTNTYSGGTSIASSSGTLLLTNAASTGTGSVTISTSGALNFTAGMTYANEINLTAASTSVPRLINSSLLTSPPSTVNVTGLITGVGNLQLSTKSNGSDGVLEVSDDSNNFTGTFATGYGFVQYTSVANAGSPSSLGAGSAIYIQNGSSVATFQYAGANADTSTRPLIWQGTTGSWNLDSSGSGSVQYLNTSPLRSGYTGTASNTETLYLTGTSTGSNVLAEPINDATPVVSGSVTYVGGATSVNKEGAGNWILTSPSTYTGATNIGTLNAATGVITPGGTLIIDASDAGNTLAGVTANASAAIAGTGTITLYGAGSTLHLLNSAASSAVSMLSTNAFVSVTDGTIIDLDLNGQTQTVSTFIVDGAAQPAGTYGSASYTGTTTGTDSQFFEGDGALVVTNSPEPSSAALLGASAIGLLRRRRRSARKV